MLVHLTNSAPITIDLTGPDANAFTLLGMAEHLGQKRGWEPERIQDVLTEMKAGKSYVLLVQTFDKYFGDQVTLYHDGVIR